MRAASKAEQASAHTGRGLTGLTRVLSLAALVGLAACGGGGSGGSSPGAGVTPSPPVSGTPAPAPAPTPVAVAGTVTVAASDANVTRLYSDSGPATVAPIAPVTYANPLYADVVLCAPGSASNCARVDHLLVDTGSVGVRVIASVLPPSLLAALPAQTTGSGALVGECLAFASGVNWGSVRQADLRTGGSADNGELAAALSIQVIADPDGRVANVPSACSAQGSLQQTATLLGANGILGVGLFLQDCGSACTSGSGGSVYFACSASGVCTRTTMALGQQVANPVSRFAQDNNGVSLVLPALGATGAPGANGQLIYGLGTRANNALAANAAVLGANGSGYFSTSFNGLVLSRSFIDSGSSVYFIPGGGTVSLPACAAPYSGYYCPASQATFSATNSGSSGTSAAATVLVGNAANLFSANPGNRDFNNLAAPSFGAFASSFSYGASFFYGRSNSVLIEGQRATGMSVAGPAFAYTP